jgi:thiamine transporter ThiT
MEFTLAIIAGIIAGFIGMLPFLVAHARIKEKMRTDGMAGIATGMIATLISFVILIALLVTCRLLAADYLLPFSLVAIAVFISAMVVYTARLVRR